MNVRAAIGLVSGSSRSFLGSEKRVRERKKVVNHAAGVVLEVGVGRGYNLPLYHGVKKIIALEPSQASLAEARTQVTTHGIPISFVCAFAECIPLLDNSVDSVISTWTLCSVTDPTKVLQEIHRVLKPGGIFAFAEHGASPRTPVYILQRLYTMCTKYFKGNCHCDRYIERYLSQSALTVKLLAQAEEPSRLLVYRFYNGFARKMGDSLPTEANATSERVSNRFIEL